MKNNRLIITLFGATGDLAARKLYPAIYRLYKNKQISKHFALIGTARRPWTDDYYQNVVLESIKDEIEDENHAKEFVSHFYYQAHDVNDLDQYYRLQELANQLEDKYETEGNRIFYISLSPALFPVITRNINISGLTSENGYNRLIIEKPFGNDLASAQELQSTLEGCFDERQIYRIDHYLGKGIVKTLLNLRFNNLVFAPLWNKDFIDQVQITMAETVGVEERGGYYDSMGVSKDMIQNHALQLLSLVAMGEPDENHNDAIRQEKIRILKHLHKYEDITELKENVVRGQYGRSVDGELPAYREESDVDPNSNTETYFAARVLIDLPEWEGVPFYIRSGKRMSRKYTTININFKSKSDSIIGNRLSIEIGPEISYKLIINQETFGTTEYMSQVQLAYSPTEEEIKAMPHDYERLILACIEGDLNNFTHWLEHAYAWHFVDHIHDMWKEIGDADFPNYPAKSNGPLEADRLLSRNGHQWFSF